jgi:hypothetical protein
VQDGLSARGNPSAAAASTQNVAGDFANHDSIADFRLIRPRVIVPEKKTRREP